MTDALHHLMNLSELEVATLNLDPGVVRLPYSPDIDVRNYVSYDNIIDKYELGPNGGLIVAMDHVAMAMGKIMDEIKSLDPEFLLVDFPGQIEIMAFRNSGSIIINELSYDNNIAGLYLIDPTLCSTASSYISTLLFGISISYRLKTAMQYVISKADLVDDERKMRLQEWYENPEFIYSDLQDEEAVLNADLSRQITNIIIELGEFGNYPMISSETNEGLDQALGLLENVWGASDAHFG